MFILWLDLTLVEAVPWYSTLEFLCIAHASNVQEVFILFAQVLIEFFKFETDFFYFSSSDIWFIYIQSGIFSFEFKKVLIYV